MWQSRISGKRYRTGWAPKERAGHKTLVLESGECTSAYVRVAGSITRAGARGDDLRGHVTGECALA